MVSFNDYDEQRKALKNWCRGREYWPALDAIQLGQDLLTGTRKDGKTPVFMHSITQCQIVRALPNLLFPQEAIALCAAHDIGEDVQGGYERVVQTLSKRPDDEDWNLDTFLTGFETITKFRYGHASEKSDEHYYDVISRHPVASVCKAVDRWHNWQTMIGVFSREKQISYIEDGDKHVLPALSRARELFPEQEAAYTLLRTMLLAQRELILTIHDSDKAFGKVGN